MQSKHQYPTALLLAASLVLGGCSAVNMVGSTASSVPDETLLERAGFTLGVDASALTLVNRKEEGFVSKTTRFTVKRKNGKGKTHSCYVTHLFLITSGGLTVSDAICSTDGKMQCNELLKAAGKC